MPAVLDIQTWAYFDPILEQRQNEGLGMDHNITILKHWSQNEFNSEKPWLLDLIFLSQLEYSIQI